MSYTPNDIIGKGLAFPIELKNGSAVLTTGWPLIISSLKTFLAFSIGRRYFLGEYGFNLKDLLQEPNMDDVVNSYIEHKLQTEYPDWEQRILVDYVNLTRPTEEEVVILVSISLKGTNINEIISLPININTIS